MKREKYRNDGEIVNSSEATIAPRFPSSWRRKYGRTMMPVPCRIAAEAGRDVAGAEQEVHQRHEVELIRPVHQRVVDVAPADVQVPGVDGVQALVVVERSVTKVVEPQQQADDRERQKRQEISPRHARGTGGATGSSGTESGRSTT